MKNNGRKVMHITLGVFLIPLGVLGLVLPILNGTVLLIVGLILLSFEIPYIEKNLLALTNKTDLTKNLHLKLDTFLRKIFGK